jgi:hypothetical protein
MKNRIKHVLDGWSPAVPDAATLPGEERPRGVPALPRGVNMLMPVELCINRELLVSLLSASIQEIHRHKQGLTPSTPERELAEVEAALQQQVAFRSWARQHPATFISIAMYPVTEVGSVEDVDEIGDF